MHHAQFSLHTAASSSLNTLDQVNLYLFIQKVLQYSGVHSSGVCVTFLSILTS